MTAGWCWSYWLPLNRHLWTSSTILWAGGWSFLLVALLHAVIDVAGIWRWAFPFVVIGANALLAYLLDPAFDRFNEFLDGSLPAMYVQPYRDVLVASYEIVILWLVLWWLYRQKNVVESSLFFATQKTLEMTANLEKR
jgi:predicted acyltransferase